MTDNRVHELLTGLTDVLRTNGIGAAGGQISKIGWKTRDEGKFLPVTAPEVIIYTRSVDDNYYPTFMSDNVLSQLGYTSEEFIEDHNFWTERIHPDDVEKALAGFRTLFEVGHHVHEYRFRHNDGTFRWMRDELNFIRDAVGLPCEILGSWTDMTESRRVEQALRESEARYRSLVNNAPMGMVSFDTRGEITEFNPALLTILGAPDFSPSEAKDLFSLVPISEAGISEAIFHCLESGEAGTGELQYKSKVDRDVYTRLHVVPVRSTDGTVSGAHAFVQDLSDQKRAEDLVVSSERLKVVGQIAMGVGFTFNNLLQVVSGNANLALTNLELRDEEATRLNLKRIVESTRPAAEAVRWLQQFGRELPYGVTQRKELFDLTNLVKEAVEICKLWSVTELAKNNIQISYRLELTSGCHVEGVPDQIVWVILNLLKNAVEAMPSGGRIKIRTSIKGNQVILLVQDSGVGIQADYIKDITVAFWTSKESHAGMGLTFNAGIVRQHKGTMGVKRVHPHGTGFVVRLPHVKDLSKLRRVPTKDSSDGAYRILLIDDDERVIKMLEEGFKRLNQTTFTACTGRDGLGILEENGIDAVVCELALGEMNGWEVGKAVRELCLRKNVPRPPIIVLTGFARQITEDEVSAHSEIDRILDKPIEVPRLLEIISEEIHKVSANAAFSGRVDRIDLLEYLQLLLLNGQQVILEIASRDGTDAYIYLDKGEIRHALCGDLEGEEALYRCLTFKGGTFSGLPWNPPKKVTINKPSQFLLIEAAHRRDEMRTETTLTVGRPGIRVQDP